MNHAAHTEESLWTTGQSLPPLADHDRNSLTYDERLLRLQWRTSELFQRILDATRTPRTGLRLGSARYDELWSRREDEVWRDCWKILSLRAGIRFFPIWANSGDLHEDGWGIHPRLFGGDLEENSRTNLTSWIFIAINLALHLVDFFNTLGRTWLLC